MYITKCAKFYEQCHMRQKTLRDIISFSAENPGNPSSFYGAPRPLSIACFLRRLSLHYRGMLDTVFICKGVAFD